MQRSAEPDVRVSANLNELSRHVADAAVAVIDDAVRRRGACAVALAGGNTPRTLYGLWASDFRDRIPWKRVHLFWGDERYVPESDPRSNYRMVKETLLDLVPCPGQNIHQMLTDFPTPEEAAEDYAETLHAYFHGDPARFDLILLGLGEDGHTASLFPGSPALAEQERPVVAVEATADPPIRLTLTMPVLTRAANIHVLVAGSNKADALRNALSDPPDPVRCPAAGLRATGGNLIWWVAGAII